MKIETIEIKNWRSIKQLEIHFQDLMIFIGQNNHGKSNIISALLFFFGEIKPQELDFNNGTQEMYVEIIFSDLDTRDCITFKKYLTSENKIKIRKTAYFSGSFEYKGFLQNPRDERLQEKNAASYTKREVSATMPYHAFLPPNGRLTKQDIIDAQNRYITENCDSLEFDYEIEETNFLGLKTVAKGIFGDVYFIPAVKDASDDFSSREASAFGKLYSNIIDSMSVNNPDWKNTKDKLKELFYSLNKHNENGETNTSRPRELTDFELLLSSELEAWGAEIDVEVTPPNIEDVFRANTQVWVNDGVRTDIKRKGHGLQRALTFALIKVISDLYKAHREATPDPEPSSRQTSLSTYFILEEPELYLHPQAQRALFDSLVSLSENQNQIILCTHASALIDVEKYKSIGIVKKDSEETGTKVFQCRDDIFSGDQKKDFNLSYWINPDRSELFFAKKVILVEGATDKTVIPLIAKSLGIFRYDYTLIDTGSKNNIPLYIELLNKFSIPYIAVYDKDHQTIKNQDARNVADQRSQAIEAVINSTIGSSIILENDIEEELGIQSSDKSKPYVAVSKISSDTFSITQSFQNKIKKIFS